MTPRRISDLMSRACIFNDAELSGIVVGRSGGGVARSRRRRWERQAISRN